MLTVWDAIKTGQWDELRCMIRDGWEARTWNCWFLCPCCGGDGGFLEEYIEHNKRTEPCGFCQESGVVGLWARLVWLWDCQIREWWRTKCNLR